LVRVLSTLARLIGQHTWAVVIDYDVVKSAALDAGVTWDMGGRIGYEGSRAVVDSFGLIKIPQTKYTITLWLQVNTS
jgi:hypothetical protein